MAGKIVLATAGTAGDLNPFIAIALELQARGLQPLIAAQKEFQETVVDAGVGFHILRPGVEDVRAELGLDAPEIVQRARRGSTGLEFAVRRIAMPFLRRGFQDMMDATTDADLVVTHTSAFAARLAAEKRGLPWISTALSPFTFMSAYDPPILSGALPLRLLREVTGARSDAALLHLVKLTTLTWTGKFQRFRAELGLPRSSNPLFEGQFSRLGTLGLYSPLFGTVQPDFPNACTLTGFCLYDRRHGAPPVLPGAVAAFLASGPAPLVFTLGSALVLDPGDFYERSAALAQRLGRRAILLVGPDAPGAAALAQGRPDLLVADYAPHSELFPHAAAIVHHGGIGTTAQALRAGRPQLVIPFSADQPDNAERVVRLGVGRAIPAAAYRMRRALKELRLLLSGDYAARAASIGQAVRQEDGPAVAAAVIEATLMNAHLPRSA